MFRLTLITQIGLFVILQMGISACRNKYDPSIAGNTVKHEPNMQHPSSTPQEIPAWNIAEPDPTVTPTGAAQNIENDIPVIPGPGWVDILPVNIGDPPIRRYICPWIDAVPDIPAYTYRVMHTYPHDPEAYTQGLYFRNGLLLESTGLRGRSSLRRVDLQSGDVLQQVDLPEPYFGEGMTVLGGKVFQLTWQEQTAFTYDLDTLEKTGEFHYKTEGWGLTEDGESLWMSDGTSRLAVIDSQTFGVVSAVEISSGYGAVSRLNELEYVEGEIWANIYQTACIARINPENGRVVGWIDLSGILGDQYAVGVDVPNGIAYDSSNKRLLVTGKLWPWLYEIEVLPKVPD